MDDLVFGPIAAGIAGSVVYHLVGHGLGWRPEVLVRRATQMTFAFVLSILAVDLILSVTTTNRDHLVLRLDNTEARLTHMEQIIQNIEKHNSEMMSNSASSTLSENPGNINEDGHPNRDETMFPDRSEDSQEDATTMKQHKPWRLFNVPEDHVFVVHCVGEKLRLLIRSPSDNLDQKVADNGRSCGGQPHEAWTPSMYDGESYRALFWMPPGDERVLVPVVWPRPDMWERLTAAYLLRTWDENPPTVEEKTPPESFTIAADEVLFYRPCEGRTTRVLIAAREDVVHLEWHAESTEEELDRPAVGALPPQSVLPLSFTESQRASREVHRVTLF